MLNTECNGGLVSAPIAVTADDLTDPAVERASGQLVTAIEADPDYSDVTVTRHSTRPARRRRHQPARPVDAGGPRGRRAAAHRRHPRRLRRRRRAGAGVGRGGVHRRLRRGRRRPRTADQRCRARHALPAAELAFRAIVVPLKAIVMNLLSVAPPTGCRTRACRTPPSAQLRAAEGARPRPSPRAREDALPLHRQSLRQISRHAGAAPIVSRRGRPEAATAPSARPSPAAHRGSAHGRR